MFSWLKCFLNQHGPHGPTLDLSSPVSQSARAFVEATGERRVEYMTLRADETDRWVLAVFYQQGPWPSRPMAYQLVTVNKKSGAAQPVATTEEDHYRLRNYK